MKHGTGSRRQRNRPNNNNGGGRRSNQQRTQVYDSNGPDVRIRGTAHQVAEKYLALAKDACAVGDRIMAENYFQHAEHYIRIINEMHGTFDLSRVEGMGSDDDNNQDENMGEAQTVSRVQQPRAEEDLGLPSSIIGVSSSSSHKQAEIAE